MGMDEDENENEELYRVKSKVEGNPITTATHRIAEPTGLYWLTSIVISNPIISYQNEISCIIIKIYDIDMNAWMEGETFWGEGGVYIRYEIGNSSGIKDEITGG